MTERCACGRCKLPSSGHLGITPAQAEVMQRLDTIRESRIRAASQSPPDLVTLASLDREAHDLRARLARLSHAP